MPHMFLFATLLPFFCHATWVFVPYLLSLRATLRASNSICLGSIFCLAFSVTQGDSKGKVSAKRRYNRSQYCGFLCSKSPFPVGGHNVGTDRTLNPEAPCVTSPRHELFVALRRTRCSCRETLWLLAGKYPLTKLQGSALK